MPVEVSNRASDGRKYKIWLDSIVFTPTGAFMNAYCILELPNSGQKIAFASHGLKFTPNGLDVTLVKLSLVNDVEVKMMNTVQLTIKKGDSTFVAMTCTGYAGVGISADVEVCRNIVKPLSPDSLKVLPDPRRVHAHIAVFMPTIDEFYAEVDIDPFVISDLEDYKWKINGVVIDFSDAKSPDYPPTPGYVSPYVGAGGISNLWRGLYMRNVSVDLPGQFNKNDQTITVGVETVMLDNNGVSGRIFLEPVLDLSGGSAGGWAFSVDQLFLTVVANRLANGGFKGRIHVSVLSNQNSCGSGAPTADDCLEYNAFIEPCSPGGRTPVYRLTVSPGATPWCMPMLKGGRVVLSPNSGVDMKIENDSFTIVAVLSGSIHMPDSLSANIALNFPDIRFENLQISNRAPHISVGTFGLADTINGKFAGFEMSVKELKMMTDGDDNPYLHVDIGLSLGSGDQGISAQGAFKIRGELKMFGKHQKFVYKNFAVEQIAINASFGPVDTLQGILQLFEDHPVYGTGWRGGVALKIKGLPGIAAVAQFGRMKSPAVFKYFFVDALICLENGVGTPLTLTGAGGGVYWHMNRPANAFSNLVCNGVNPTISPVIGTSLSGIVYVPDPSKSIGIKLTVALAVANERAFNANATFEILFNTGGGLSDIWIYGNARFMAIADKTASPAKTTNNGSPISASLDMHFNFDPQGATFDGIMEVYMNVNNGTLKGSGANNRLCQAVIHASANHWYIKVGSPAVRAGVIINIPGIGPVSQVSTYMEIGKDLDAPPGLPQEIAQLTGLDTDPAVLSNRSGVNPGSGFIYGADIQIGNKEYPPFLNIFYAGFKVRLGYDLALLDYGNNAICAGSGEQIGIDG